MVSMYSPSLKMVIVSDLSRISGKSPVSSAVLTMLIKSGGKVDPCEIKAFEKLSPLDNS